VYNTVLHILTLDCWCEEKDTNVTSPDYQEKVWHCSKKVGTLGMTSLNSQWIPPNSSSSLPDKVNFQLFVSYYEPLKQASSHPKRSWSDDGSASIQASKHKWQTPYITNLIPLITATSQIPVKKLKLALFFCFSTQIYVVYAESSSPGIPKLFCPRAKWGDTEQARNQWGAFRAFAPPRNFQNIA